MRCVLNVEYSQTQCWCCHACCVCFLPIGRSQEVGATNEEKKLETWPSSGTSWRDVMIVDLQAFNQNMNRVLSGDVKHSTHSGVIDDSGLIKFDMSACLRLLHVCQFVPHVFMAFFLNLVILLCAILAFRPFLVFDVLWICRNRETRKDASRMRPQQCGWSKNGEKFARWCLVLGPWDASLHGCKNDDVLCLDEVHGLANQV